MSTSSRASNDSAASTTVRAPAEKTTDGELTRVKTEDIVYPTGIKLALIILSLYLAIFLTALVSGSSDLSSALRILTNTLYRIEPLSQPQFRASRTTSTLWAMSDGMVAPFF
jgi:hypothetical protein